MTTSHSRMRTRLFASAAALAALSAFATAAPTAASTSAQTAARAKAVKPTVVLVHGAWADASSFSLVTEKLQDHGYTVLSAPNPLRGLQSDAASVAAFVDQATTGPVVLVGHSYGGSVITNAATQSSRVTALVYVDAYAPAKGESVIDLTGASPGSALAVADPTQVFNFVHFPGARHGDLDTYIKPELFKDIMVARLSTAETKVLAANQRPVTLSALQAPSKKPAWKKIKSFFFIGTSDKVLPAAQQRVMAQRADGVVVEHDADHLSMLEAPKQVAALIEKAAKTQ